MITFNFSHEINRPTFAQYNYAKKLLKERGENISNYNLEKMKRTEIRNLIDKLREE